MGRISSRNKSLLITLLIAAIFVSSILTSVTLSLDENNSLFKNSDASDGNDWLELDSDGDGIGNGNDMCPFLYFEPCSVLLNSTNSLYSKISNEENETIVDVEFSPDGQYIAVASWWYGVIILDSISHEVEKYLPLSSYYSEFGYMSQTESIAFSNDGSILAIFGSDGLLEVSTGDWEILSVYLADQYESHFGGADIVFSPDDSQIAIAANYNFSVGQARIWDRLSQYTVADFRIESNGMFYEDINAIDYSKDGYFLALAQGNQFAIYDTTNWDLVTSFTNDNTSEDCENYHGCSNYAKDLEFSNNGLYLAVSHFNSSIEVFSTNIVCQDCSSWELLPEKSMYVSEKFELEEITFSPDSNSIISLWEGEDYYCYCGKIKIFDIHNNTLISFDINGEGLLWDVAISPDGNSIAFGDNDAYMDYDADWEELPDGTGLFTIELDSDSDGVRDSIDECETEDGVVVNETGCEAVTEDPANSIDNGLISDGYFTFLCFLLLLFVCFIFFTIWYYHDEMEPAFAWIPLGITIVILIVCTGPIVNAISDDNSSFECPDGTIVTYGESKDIRDETGQELSEFIESPPPHWCDESTAWLNELTDGYAVKMIGVWAGVLFVVCLLLFAIDYKLDVTFISVNINTPNVKPPSIFSENFWLGLLFLSLIAILLLPIASIESNVESVPGHDWIMQQSCDEGEDVSECWKNDGIDDDSQYRKGLGTLFGVGLVTLIAGAAFVGLIDDTWGMVIGGFFMLTSLFAGIVWLYGTIVLGLLEVFAGNMYWITSFSVSILSFVGFVLSSDSTHSTSTSNSSSSGYTPNQVSHPHNNRNNNSKSSSKGSITNNSNYGGKIDHDLIRQLIGQYSDNNDVLTAYQSIASNRTGRVKESKLINAIDHRRSEYNKSGVGSKKQSNSQQNRGKSRTTYHNLTKSDLLVMLKTELVDIASSANLSTSGTKSELIERIEISKGWKAKPKSTLASQGSNKSWARESSSVKQKASKSPSTNPQTSSESQVIKPMNLHTDILSSTSSKPADVSVPEFKADSNGIMTKRTSFSVVTINHVQNRVEKVPTDKSLNPMFLEEIRVMKSLEDKGIDVGLLDYDEGENPKIVTRYFGSHKLGEVIETASPRGKNNLITGLIEQVGKIHKAGWVHRDLKPDNIMVDIRPRDGNHRFDAIIDYGIAMKINRKQMDIHNTAGTKFFGHSSQKESDFNASTGQDWFSLARIIALIVRGSSIESLNAEIQMSQTGLDISKELRGLEFESEVADCLSKLVEESTNPRCDDLDTVGRLSVLGKQIVKLF